MLVIWLVVARGARVPPVLSTRVYALPALDHGKAAGLMARLQALPGVHEALVSTAERTACALSDSGVAVGVKLAPACSSDSISGLFDTRSPIVEMMRLCARCALGPRTSPGTSRGDID